MARDTKEQVAWGAVIAIIMALWGWSFVLSGRLSAVETKADAAMAAAEYYRLIDQRLSRIEGKLGVEGR
ncbi:MAG TPA: hypothetical protein VN428_02305 [Bryobacteraceae bacterium]|nr:hypothetical protein [Bryobacteraceae bacterium]